LWWPLSGVLNSEIGWRGTCLVHAGLQLGLALPIYLLALPREPRPAGIEPASGGLASPEHERRYGGPRSSQLRGRDG
jgi:hypothetical protein